MAGSVAAKPSNSVMTSPTLIPLEDHAGSPVKFRSGRVRRSWHTKVT